MKLGNFTAAEDKRRYAYVLTPKGIKEKSIIASRFLKRKLAEYEALKQEIEELSREQMGFDEIPSKPGGIAK